MNRPTRTQSSNQDPNQDPTESGAEIINKIHLNEEQLIKHGIRDLCYIGLGIILFVAILVALGAWGINQIEEKQRFAPPKVIAKYEPKPWYPAPKIPEHLIEYAEAEKANRLTE